MARRRRGNNRLRLFTILSVVVIVGLIVAIMTTPAGDLLVEASDEVKMIVNGWVIPASFTFAITSPNNGVSCFIGDTLIFEYAIGNRVVVDQNTISVPIVTVFSVTDPADELAVIVDIDLTGTIVCEPVGSTFSIDVVGGSVTYIWKTRNELGQEVQIKRQDKSIPTFARNAINGVKLPSGSVFANEIENAVNLQNVRDKTVPISADVTYNILLKTSATGDLFNSGQINTQAGGTVKVVSVTATPPPTPSGRNVDITTVIPSQVNFVGTATPSGNQIGEGDFISIRAIGTLDDWQSSEGNPFVNVKAPNGQILLTNQVMNPTGTTGSISSFSTGIFQITSLAVRENNIAGFDGLWTVEMHSNNDVRAVVDSMNFALVDARETEPIIPDDPCTIDEEPDGMGGCKPKETPTTVPTITCPSLSDIATFISVENNQALLDKKAELEALQAQGNTQLCVTQFLAFVNQEILVRGITVTPDPTGITSTQAFIEYLANYSPKGSEQSGCTIPTSGTVGRLPTSGIDVTGFQLLGMGSPCQDNIWQATDMSIVIDFGNDIQDFIPDRQSLDTEARMIISVNNPFPSAPNFVCTGGSTTSLPTCTFTNHNFLNDKVGSVGVTASEFVETGVLVDQQAGDPRYALATVKLQNNAIKDKIQKDHILLDGDKVEVMFYTWGKFGGTFKGDPVTGAFLPLWYVEKFTWDDTGVQIKCKVGETLREDRTCKPSGDDICESPNKRDAQGVCRPPVITDPDDPDLTDNPIDPTVTCEASLVENIPMCNASTEDVVPTGETDACDIPFLECRAKGDPNVMDKTDPTTMPSETEPNMDGGCNPMYIIDTATGKCKLIGGGDLGGGDDTPDGGGGQTSTCAGGDIGACFAELIQGLQQGFPTFTFGTGIDPIIFVGIAIAVIALVAVGIIVRRRRGAGGF